MTVTADAMRKLAALRLDPDQMAGVMDIMADMIEAEENRKRKQRERVANHRARNGDVTLQKRDSGVTPTLQTEKPNDFSCEQAPAHVVNTSTSNEVGLREDNHTTLPRGRAALDNLENQLREAAGYQNSPYPKLMMLAPILGLLDQGMSLDEDVLPVIRSKATQLRQARRPDAVSWEFFRNAIVEHHHARKRAVVVPFSTASPKPQGETQMEMVRRVLAEGKS